jgi:large subunit ribosomal protein L25
MEQATISFVVRSERKKGPARKLRRQGMIPSIIYGRNEPVAIAVNEHEFGKRFKNVSESTIITLKSDNASYDVLVKDYQEDIIKGKIQHIDFFEIERGKLLRTHVPVHLSGTSIGVREGGILELITHELEIECLPRDLPQEIVVDITEMAIGHSLHVSDLEEIEGVRVMASNDQVVCTVTRRREVIEEVEEEEEVLEEEAAAEAAEVEEAAEEEE